MSHSTDNWNLESLNKAYQQGYMAGLTGAELEDCPYGVEVLAAAWEAGWDDGSEQCEIRTHQLKSKIA